MTKARIQVSHENGAYYRRKYSITEMISDKRIASFNAPISRDTCVGYLESLGPTGKSIVSSIFAATGIDEVVIRPYEVVIRIGEAFRWGNGIHADILDVLMTHVFDENEEIDVLELGLKDFEKPDDEKSTEERKGGAQPTY